MGNKSFYCKYIKVFLSFFIALCTLVLLSWLFVILAIAIKINDPSGPVIFKQDRIGKFGKVYKMYKFRSMFVGSENKGSGVYSNDDDDRITKVGLFLRRTSLDEIPQFFNILKGDMSLIGFRSPLTYHPWSWEKYSNEQKLMFSVRPGLTGWAQVHGRRTVDWSDRIQYNCWYAKNVNFLLDVKIFFMTIVKIFSSKDNQNIKNTV